MSDSQAVLDVEGVLDRVAGDHELFYELVTIFFDTYELGLSNLKTAVAEKNYTGMEESAHSLKSALGNIGAMKCFHLAANIEAIGRNQGDIEEGQKLYNDLEQGVGDFRSAFEEYKTANPLPA